MALKNRCWSWVEGLTCWSATPASTVPSSRSRRDGIAEDTAACSGAVITVAAGEPWDPLVQHAIERGWSGLEPMSGIPGLVGATPIQNVGAYGADVSELISMVRTLDRSTGQRKTLFPIECGFGYRTSRFKSDPGRFVVLSVTFQLRIGSMSQPIRYPELARLLGVEVGQRAPAAEVRQAVLALRSAKGMVLVEDDHDTWSVGSFFTNPIFSQATARDSTRRRTTLQPTRWQGQDQCRLAHRTGRLWKGVRPRGRPAVRKAHPGTDQ